MKFKNLEMTGFKSFSEKTTVLIEKGLTGIVGPNGCGKSNIVEALRWCMGENSAKSIRGSGMEDVIFSGTSNRPSKNISEVSLLLDNNEKNGPIQYKEFEEISVKRKIEKDKGSKYYINDKEVRARDVQTFFADLSTGAHSPSLISQGRIGQLVTAKPIERKSILEEAAGISGIHARRQEAETRLNAAENNLKRADELKKQQQKQLDNLKKQAEEATRYKEISKEIKFGLHKFNTYSSFSKRIKKSRKKLTKILEKLKNENKKIIGYGATAKSCTVLNYCRITKKHIAYFLDTTPDKINKFLPGSKIQIKKYKRLSKKDVDVAFLGAWNFKKEILKKEKKFIKEGGKFLLHVPSVRLI